MVSPAGRFSEWKAVLHAGWNTGQRGRELSAGQLGAGGGRLVVVPGARLNAQNLAQNQQGMISIAFPSSNQNVTITFDSNATAPLQAMKDRTAITVRWAAHDDNGDDLIFSLYLRGDGEKVWRLLKDQITDKAYSFDATLIPDGGYEIKVVASDSPSHTPGDALTGAKESERFEVDTTPPVVSGLKAMQPQRAGARLARSRSIVTFDAEDAVSPIAHAEYSLDAGTWQFIEPVGELSDSRREHYDVQLPARRLTARRAST